MRMYEWTIKVRVAANIVADGLNLSEERRMHNIVSFGLPFVRGDEIEVEIVEAPPADDILREQGYDVAEKKPCPQCGQVGECKPLIGASR